MKLRQAINKNVGLGLYLAYKKFDEITETEVELVEENSAKIP